MNSDSTKNDRSSPIRNRSRSAEKLRNGCDPTPICVVSRYINSEYKGIRPKTSGRRLTGAKHNGSQQIIPKSHVTLESALAEV
jgi:hypothetical protein